MTDFSMNEKMIIVQYGIKKYENEETLVENLKSVLSEKDIQMSIDTLIGTQKVRRIGPEILQKIRAPRSPLQRTPRTPRHLRRSSRLSAHLPKQVFKSWSPRRRGPPHDSY